MTNHFQDPGPQFDGEPTRSELAEEAEDTRIERLEQIAVGALAQAIREFPEIDPKELHDELLDVANGQDVVREASVKAIAVDTGDIKQQLALASKAAQILTAQTMITDRQKAGAYAGVVGSISCAIADLGEAERLAPLAAE